MGFTSAISNKTVFGNKRVHFGTWTNTSSAGTAGGNVNTGLRSCEMFLGVPGGAAAQEFAVNETLPVAGSAVTIVTEANATGYWLAVGY